jgi:hypothetical protein
VDSGTILILIVLITIPIGAIAFAASGPALKQLGKGRFAIEQELPRKTMGAPPPINRKEQEAEVRQMVEAKSYRREARGEPALDVEAEVERLLGANDPTGSLSRDVQLREEVRQLVVARNERRMRRGEKPLNVEQEIDRQLRDLENLGQ